MANNTDFAKVTVKDVELLWPRLDQTYRYNSQEKKTEACAPSVQGAGWSVSWLMPNDEAKQFFTGLKDHYNKVRESNRKLPEFGGVFGMKKQEDDDGNLTGFTQFTARKRAVSNQGKQNKEPRIVGPDLKNLEDKAIWTGSKGSVRALAFPTTDPDGKGGISLLLDAVQVIEAVYGSDNLEDDFDVHEASEQFERMEDDHMATASAAVANTAAPADAEF